MNRLSILIVEDEAIVAADLARRLQQLGYTVAGSTKRGEEALQLARQHRPSLVLMDIRLAGAMDGIATAKAIRSELDLPVVFLSAHSDRATLERAKLAEPYGYILKPFEERELQTVIEMTTYKHQAEQQVRQHQEWLRVTLTSISDAVITCDTEGRIKLLNPAAETVTGWKAQECLGLPVQRVLTLVDDETHQPCDNPVAGVLRTGQAVAQANRLALVTKDGREVAIEDSAAPIIDTTGRVTGVVVVFRDVTESRRAQAALRASEKRNHQLMQLLPVAVYTCDAEGRITFVNDHTRELVGRDPVPDDNRWHLFHALCRPDGSTLPPGDCPMADTVRTGRRLQGEELTVVRPDGSERCVMAHIEPLRNEAGEIAGAVNVLVDITEHKRLEEQTRLQAAALQATANAVAIVSPQGAIQWTNAAFTRLTGYTAAEVVNQNPRVLKSGQHPPEFYRNLWETVLAGQVWRGELVNRRKDGSRYTEEMTITPVTDARGAITQFIAIKQDTTERKRREDTLRFLVQAGTQPKEHFFQALASHLARSLDMEFVCIDRLEEGLLSAQTLAVFHNGQFEDNVAYALKDTPCGKVVGQRICCFPQNVRKLFPKDAVLQELQAESYLGTTLWNALGKPIGLIAVIGRRPLQDTRLAESILQVVGAHAAGELERLQAEAALRASEARYRAIGESIDYGVWMCDVNGRNTYASESFLQLVGQTQEQCSSFGWSDVLHPEDTARTIAAWKECVRTGGKWDIEHRCRGVDGQYHAVLARGVPVRNERGEIISWAGINLDISRLKQTEEALRQARDELEQRVIERTEELLQTVTTLQAEIDHRQQAEQALRDSEARYRTLFESAPMGIAILNRQGKVLECNRRMVAMAGLNPEVDRPHLSANFFLAPVRRRQMLAQLHRTGQVAEWEDTLKPAGGAALVVRLHMGEIQMGRQRVLMTMLQDITVQKQAEKHFEGIRALLELFTTKAHLQDYLNSVVQLLQNWCACRAVGIRLLETGGLIPFAAHVGFSRTFLRQEKAFCLQTDECACARVLMSQCRSEDVPCTSRNGSFFCNRTSQYAENLSAVQAGKPQAACLAAGYESLAQSAIRYRGRLVGTIHLADRIAGRFPPETISFIESVTPLIGEAIQRFHMEASFHESEARFRTMFECHGTVMLLLEPKAGALVDANPAAADFYGYPRETLRSMNLADLNAVPRATPTAQPRGALRQRLEPDVFPHRLANGEIRTVEVHSSPMTIRGRRLSFLIIHDITERKLLEKQVLEISESERQRVGQDLHDTLGSRLTGTAMMIKALAQGLAARALPEAALAEEVVQSIHESIADTRAIARGLCPVEMSVVGLNGGLTELAAEIRHQSNIACHFRADPQVKVRDGYVATHLIQIVREAVTNAIRHGHAKHISIRLTGSTDHTALEVRDDGTGLPKQAKPTKGLGLRIMRYRANAIGAELAIRSGGNGTVVSCRLPAGSAALNNS